MEQRPTWRVKSTEDEGKQRECEGVKIEGWSEVEHYIPRELVRWTTERAVSIPGKKIEDIALEHGPPVLPCAPVDSEAAWRYRGRQQGHVQCSGSTKMSICRTGYVPRPKLKLLERRVEELHHWIRPLFHPLPPLGSTKLGM